MTPKNGSEQNRVRILIVDDEADITTIIKKGLEREGFSVDTSNDPRKALAGYRLGEHDLLLLDIRMPHMTGFELFREIRKIDKKVKVCFITAFEIYYDEFRRVFPKIHVNCFIRKPATIEQLAKAVREELARSAPLAEKEEEEPMPRQHQHKGT